MRSISIIIATRNRPVLFAAALRSVVLQTYENVEIVIINDGSDQLHQNEYQKLVNEAMDQSNDNVQYHCLAPRRRGHGAEYARNFGVAHARGDYIAFLDDDDCWIDEKYLFRAASIVAEATPVSPIDLVFANQSAYISNVRQPGPVWLEGLASELDRSGQKPGRHGEFRVEVSDLMATGNFCHLNTTIVRRELFDEAGGMDETIGWEGDRDLYLRLIDTAREIRYLPHVVSRHNVPLPTNASSITTRLSMIERRLSQLRLLDKAALFAEHAEIRHHGLRHKGYALKKIAEDLAAAGRPALALRYAREALGLQPTLKWAGFTLLLALRAIGQRP